MKESLEGWKPPRIEPPVDHFGKDLGDLRDHAQTLGPCDNPHCVETHRKSRKLLLCAAEDLEKAQEHIKRAQELSEEVLLMAQTLAEFHGLKFKTLV